MVRGTDSPDMTTAIDWDVKNQNKKCGSCYSINVYVLISMSHHMRFCIYRRCAKALPHADVSSGAGGLIVGQSIHLHPYFVYASSLALESLSICAGSPEPCDKYQNLMRWFIFYMDLDTRKPVSGVCEQQWRRPVCAPAQSD